MRPPILGIVETRWGRLRLATFSTASLVVVVFENPIMLWSEMVGMGASFLDMLS